MRYKLLLIAICIGWLMSSPANSAEINGHFGGVKANASGWWSGPNGGRLQYELSKTDAAPFSKITGQENGFAGFSHIWINGIPWLVPVFFADMDTVSQAYPWYSYPVAH